MKRKPGEPLGLTTPFALRVYDVVRKIPKGKTLTYKQVATAAGKPNASRAVGNILNKNRHKDVPCHRVVRSDGKAGGYAWGTTQKQAILKREGARLARGR
jgi:O-6-methylguanine DNA methyltransferase